jgi:excinuclease ABC subunit A
VVITGISGSGKSSLAFDTIYAEGQRRYVESLSAYARQFLGLMEKPDVDAIEGLSPAISIEQKTISRTPGPPWVRSRRSTTTCASSGRGWEPPLPRVRRPVERQSSTQIVDRLLELEEGTRMEVLAPLVRGGRGSSGNSSNGPEGGLRPGSGGRGDLRPFRPAEAESVRESRCGRGGGPAGEREGIGATGGFGGDGAPDRGGVLEVLEHGKGGGPRATSSASATPAPAAGPPWPELEPRQFSFNSPYGACPECGGLGTRREVSPELVLSDPSLSILEGVILPWGEPSGHLKKLRPPGLAEAYEFDLKDPLGPSFARGGRVTPCSSAPGR